MRAPIRILTLFAVCACLLGGCDRIESLLGQDSDPSVPSEESSSTGETSEDNEGQEAPSQDSEDELDPAPLVELPDVEAHIPTGALAGIPEGVDGVILLDVASVRDFGTELVGFDPESLYTEELESELDSWLRELDVPDVVVDSLNLTAIDEIGIAFDVVDESIVLVTNIDSVSLELEDGGAPEPFTLLQVARRGDWAIMGMGPAFTSAIDPSVARYEPARVWTDGWGAIPDDSALTVFFPDASVLPPEAIEELSEMGIQLHRVAAGVPLDGVFGLAVDMEPADMPARLLGFLQSTSQFLVIGLRQEAPREALPALAYLELIGRAFWSQIQVDRSGTMTRITFADPPCGSGWFYPVTLGVLAALASDMERDWESASTFVPVEQRLGERCGRLAGGPARIPRSLARLAPQDTDGLTFLLLWDLAGIARAFLPRAGGVLPFALHPDDISNALGESPLGLAGLDDSEGSGAFAFEAPPQDAPGSETGTGLVVLHPGVVALVPEATMEELRAEPEITAVELREGLGFTIADAELVHLFVESSDPNSPYVQLIGAMPESAALALVVGGFPSDELSLEDAPEGLRDLIEASSHVALSLDTRLIPTVRLQVRGDATALAAGAQESFSALVAEALTELPVEVRAEISRFLGDPTTWLRFEATSSNQIGLELDANNALILAAAAAGAALYTLGVNDGADLMPDLMGPADPYELPPVASGAFISSVEVVDDVEAVLSFTYTLATPTVSPRIRLTSFALINQEAIIPWTTFAGQDDSAETKANLPPPVQVTARLSIPIESYLADAFDIEDNYTTWLVVELWDGTTLLARESVSIDALYDFD